MQLKEKKIGKLNAYLNCFLHRDFFHDNEVQGEYEEKRPALLLIPGGAYTRIAEREGDPVAYRFLFEGYEVFVLYYTTGEDIKNSDPVQEAAEAVQWIRSLPSVDPEKIAVMGFSAGGHLAASLASYGYRYNASVTALVLGYPVISMADYAHEKSKENFAYGDVSRIEKYSLEKADLSHCPPTYIFSTADDAAVDVRNSIRFYENLLKQGIVSELHIYPTGVHGLSIATKETGFVNKKVATWVEEAIAFLQDAMHLF
jgi:acetyl esterase/lipase